MSGTVVLSCILSLERSLRRTFCHCVMCCYAVLCCTCMCCVDTQRYSRSSCNRTAMHHYDTASQYTKANTHFHSFTFVQQNPAGCLLCQFSCVLCRCQ